MPLDLQSIIQRRGEPDPFGVARIIPEQSVTPEEAAVLRAELGEPTHPCRGGDAWWVAVTEEY